MLRQDIVTSILVSLTGQMYVETDIVTSILVNLQDKCMLRQTLSLVS